MGKFDDILLCSDLDGTLLNSKHIISDENKKAIEYFKSEGGIFTFVTGRMPFFVTEIYNRVQPNAPFGCVNGGGLYDGLAQKYVWTAEMDGDVFELVRTVDEKLPNVGIQVNTYDKVYFCKDNDVMVNFRKVTKLRKTVRDYNEIDEPIAKIVFGSDSDDEIEELERLLKGNAISQRFDFIRSEKTLYEILPKGTGKGNAVTNLVKLLEIDLNKTIAIGDYDNDISMFKAAGVGIAVANACDNALATADCVTVSNDENAVAEVIYNLEKYMR